MTSAQCMRFASVLHIVQKLASVIIIMHVGSVPAEIVGWGEGVHLQVTNL